MIIAQYKRVPPQRIGLPNIYSMGSFKWLTESNRWKHLVLAICIGLWYNVTEEHKAAVNTLTTIEEVDAYDYKTGYPEKLSFEV